MANINDMTIGEFKEIATLLNNSAQPSDHPLEGKRVVAVLPHGFIHFGKLESVSGRLTLTDAHNLRYWAKRDGGLPEFAAKGPSDEDRIDLIGTTYLEHVLFFYPCGDWA